MRLGEMPWTAVREAIASGVTAVIPLGSIEEHGPHAPMGDYIVVDEVAARATDRTVTSSPRFSPMATRSTSATILGRSRCARPPWTPC